MLLDGIFYNTVFKHVPISDEATWKATLTQWKADALALGEEGVFIVSDVEKQLDWLKNQYETEKDIHNYFLVKEGNLFASSILEMAHAMPKSEDAWLKLLSLTLRPALMPREGMGTDAMTEGFTTIVSSVVFAVAFIFNEHLSKELKIFGRTPEIRRLFDAIITSGILNSELDRLGLMGKLEGNWLVLTKIS